MLGWFTLIVLVFTAGTLILVSFNDKARDKAQKLLRIIGLTLIAIVKGAIVILLAFIGIVVFGLVLLLVSAVKGAVFVVAFLGFRLAEWIDRPTYWLQERNNTWIDHDIRFWKDLVVAFLALGSLLVIRLAQIILLLPEEIFNGIKWITGWLDEGFTFSQRGAVFFEKIFVTLFGQWKKVWSVA